MTNWQEAKTARENKRKVQNSNPCWSNLCDDFCPICDCIVEINDKDNTVECSSCQFSISMDKFDEIIKNIEEKEFYGS